METAPSVKLPVDASARSGARFTRARWERVRAFWPESAAVLLLLGLLANAVHTVRANEGGRFVYSIDDGFFHMSVARNLLRHGLWGISPLNGFSSGTSSLLWPLIIAAAFAVFGVHEYVPLLLNVLAAIGLIFYAGSLVRRVTASAVLGMLILGSVVFLTPLLAVASTGMEHCLQCLLGMIFVDRAARLLSSETSEHPARPGAEAWLCAVGVLLVMTRYEGLFLVAPVGLLLLCQRRWRLAVTLGISTAAPITLFGLLAVSKGWYFLPNSLLLKGYTQLTPGVAGVLQYFQHWYEAMVYQKHMFPVVAAVVATLLGCLRRGRTLWTYPAVFLFVTLAALLQHLQLAQLGWFYRYEAYLLALSFIGVGVALGGEPAEGPRDWLTLRALPQYAVLSLAAVIFGAPLWVRALDSMRHVVTASYNIYEQQYQMGHFVGRYYKHRGVAANDIGAISYFGESDILDLVGLSDIDVLRAKRTGDFNQETMRRLLRKHRVEVVIVYDQWAYTYGGILPEWTQVGRWTIPNNTIVASDTVSFYAPSAEFVPVIKRQLREFRPTLPGDVTQAGAYVSDSE